MPPKDKKKADPHLKGAWVGYRPEIKVLDCTIRDGGLMNDHKFEDGLVRGVYDACVRAGVDYLELGYKASKKVFAPASHGAWKFCDEDALRRITGDNPTDLKLAVMADAERTDYHTDILPKEKSVIDLVRVATYIHQIPTALDMIKDAHDKGYETTVNLMAVSTVPDQELEGGLEGLAESEVEAIYLVDSFGFLYGEQIQYLMKKYLRHARAAGKDVGIHTHNNQQLAFANTVEAIVQGANRLDASMGGLGRGAGNCSMELLLNFLHNPKYDLRHILACVRDHIEPLRSQFQWGYDIPYMLTGQLNQHPRAAIRFLAGEDRKDYVKFYDTIME
ncbi:MAG: aldolase catalytic domain-containing protein [Planctomycetota bacterium]